MSCERLSGELVHYQRGELDGALRAEIGLHLEDCLTCRRGLAEVAEIELAIASAPLVEASPRFEERMRRALPRVYADGVEADRRLAAEPAVPRPLARVRRLPRVIAASLVLHVAAILLLSVLVVFPERSPFSTAAPVSVRIGDDDFEMLPPVAGLPNEEAGPDLDVFAPGQIESEEAPEFGTASPVGLSTLGPSVRPGAIRSQAIRRTLLAELAPWIRGRLDWRDAADGERRSAIDGGLDWLARTQDAGGSWSPEDFGGQGAHRVGTTALATLAFLGAGHAPSIDDPHGYTLALAIEYLNSVRNAETGRIGTGTLYDHAIATLALIEAGFVRRGPRGAFVYQTSVDYILVCQDPVLGGWGYGPGDAPDTSVTGWQVATLAVARAVGLSVPSPALERAAVWFESLTDPSTGRVGYHEACDRPGADYALTAVGLGSETLLERIRPVARRQVETLVAPGSEPDLYGLYQALAALRSSEDPAWTAWEPEATRRILDMRDVSGSWYPDAGYGREGGRVCTTALAILALESPFRYGSLR